MSEYSDIDFNFKSNPITKDLQRVSGADSVKSSLRNILKLNSFDKVFQPNIASDIKTYLFEPVNTLTSQRLQIAIDSAIGALEPRAQNYEVNVEAIPEDNEFRVEIKFYVIDQLQPVQFETFLSRVR